MLVRHTSFAVESVSLFLTAKKEKKKNMLPCLLRLACQLFDLQHLYQNVENIHYKMIAVYHFKV